MCLLQLPLPPHPCKTLAAIAFRARGSHHRTAGAGNDTNKSTTSNMASRNSAAARVATAATTFSSDNQSLIAEIRRSLGVIKGIAVDMEREEQSDKVKELEEVMLELLGTYDDSTTFSEAILSIGDKYQPSDQVTDFRKLMEDEVNKLKEANPFVAERSPLYRQFREAIWNVHHVGQPMPGEEQEDIVMTSTQCNILNITCPLTGKPIIQLENPVRCMDCKHIYEKDPILQYIRTKKPTAQCPVAGCPKILKQGRVICDPLLPIDIDELRTADNETTEPTNVEDFTELD